MGGVLESLPLYDNKSKAVAAFFSFLASASVMRSFLIGRLVRGIVPQSSCLQLQEEIGEDGAAWSPNRRRAGEQAGRRVHCGRSRDGALIRVGLQRTLDPLNLGCKGCKNPC